MFKFLFCLLLFLNITTVFGYTISLDSISVVFPRHPNAIIEDFEDANYVTGLSSPNVIPNSSPGNVWDGNSAAAQLAGGIFNITLPNVRIFSIGIGDNDSGGETVVINESVILNPNGLPNFTTSGAGIVYYMNIFAENGDADITSIRFTGSTLGFDHIEIVQTSSSVPEPSTLSLIFLALATPFLMNRFRQK